MTHLNNQQQSMSIIKQSAPATVRFETPRFLASANFSSASVVPAGFWDKLGRATQGAIGGLMS